MRVGRVHEGSALWQPQSRQVLLISGNTRFNSSEGVKQWGTVHSSEGVKLQWSTVRSSEGVKLWGTVHSWAEGLNWEVQYTALRGLNCEVQYTALRGLNYSEVQYTALRELNYSKYSTIYCTTIHQHNMADFATVTERDLWKWKNVCTSTSTWYTSNYM